VMLAGEFWAERAPMINLGETLVPTETALRRVLDEARYVFSGMIYGFSFSYTPSDVARRVAEELEIRPLAEISPGDPNLLVQQVIDDGQRVTVLLRYALRDFQIARYQGWKSSALPTSGGTGSASFFKGHTEKISAIREALKMSVREYVRLRVYNKPRRISGAAVLEEAPRIVIAEGVYKAACRVRFVIDEIVPYSIY
jgi:hypothetical protein